MTDHQENDDAHGENDNQAEELERILREMLSGTPGAAMAIDPAQLAQLAGLSGDSAAIGGMLETLRSALQNSQAGDGEIDWSVARKTALEVATTDAAESDASPIQAAFSTASLWLDEATDMGAPADSPRTLTRADWVVQTIDTWTGLATPVAHSITDALTSAVREQMPEEVASAMQGADQMIRGVSGALFAMQLGTVVGNLSREVISAGDIGIPLITGPNKEGGALLPQNVDVFREGLELNSSEIHLFLAVRELAHARLFRHAKWLRSHLMSAVTEYAKGIEIDTMRIENIAHEIDPMNPEQLQELVRNGSLIPPRTPRQEIAHNRLETMLALIDGWVDVVTREATSLLPGADALAEMIRRRRAAGGPAERAFSTLVGLELRPKKLREAARMWQLVAENGGKAARDELWAHPDILPTAEEIEHPARLLERIGLAGDSAPSELDEFDRELQEFLDSAGERPAAAEDGSTGGTRPESDEDDGSSPENP